MGRAIRTLGRRRTPWASAGAAARRVRDLRYEVILQAGARCFNRRGYHATTMADIARDLGVSKAALYYYVRNKEEILFQTHSAALDFAMEGIRLAAGLGGPADARLHAALRHFIERMTDRLKGCVLLTEGMLSPGLYRQLVGRRDEYEGELRRLVEDGVAAGVFAPCEPKLVVLAMLGAMNWIPRWYAPDGPRTPGEIGEAFAAYLVRGLKPGERGTSGAAPMPEGGG